jgi:methionine aminotransferase
MKSEDEYLSLQEFYEKKRNIVLEILKDSRFKFTPTKGTFFQLLDYSGISGLNDMDFTADLTKEKGIATIPLSPFYSGINNNKIIRICFAKKNDALVKAANILKEI